MIENVDNNNINSIYDDEDLYSNLADLHVTVPNNGKHVLIVDGDYFVFHAMAACEHETLWEDDVFTLECDHGAAKEVFLRALRNIRAYRKSFKDSLMVLAFTDKHNWRKDVLPSYKANRKKTRKPTGYQHFLAQVLNEHEAWMPVLVKDLEGDDVMGILGTNPELLGVQSCTLVSCDKDFKTIPTEFIQLKQDHSIEVHKTTLEDADKYHMYQTLIGDVTDGYGGIPSVGATSAKSFLESPYKFYQEPKTFKSGKRKGETIMQWKKYPMNPLEDTLWDCMITLADKQGMSKEELLVQAQVARICRTEDYDFNKQQVILWENK